MNPNRTVRKFNNYDDARDEKKSVLRQIIDSGLEGQRKVKIKLRRNGTYDVISYDIVHKEEEVVDD